MSNYNRIYPRKFSYRETPSKSKVNQWLGNFTLGASPTLTNMGLETKALEAQTKILVSGKLNTGTQALTK